jgi:hypothetical protein
MSAQLEIIALGSQPRLLEDNPFLISDVKKTGNAIIFFKTSEQKNPSTSPLSIMRPNTGKY